MREIKFRGYAKQKMVNSQWLEGFGIYELEYAEHYAKEIGRSSDWYLFTEGGNYCVYPESIGQYTGLKDKNGKEIYEGDLLKAVAYAINQEVTGVVNYNSELAHYCLDTDNNKRIVFLGLINTEVIGNIYENPELLEG